MTAIILTPEQAASLLAAVQASYQARSMAPYWQPLPMPVVAGPYQGMVAVDVGPKARGMVMIHGLTLEQLPDYQPIMDAFGGGGAVEVADADLMRPLPSLGPTGH